MKNACLLFCTLCIATIFHCSPSLAESSAITMHLPQQVLAEALQKSLPVVLSRATQSLGGTISIKRIDNLALGNQSISAMLGLDGKNVQINTAIGSHQIALNVGNVQVDFSINAKLRFDEATQTLFIKPAITDINQGPEQKNKEIGALIASLFHDKELPLVIDQLQPIVANTGDKQLIIHMHVRDIIVQPDGLKLEISPAITAAPRTQ